MELLGSDTIVAEALKLPVADRVEVLHRLWDSLPRVANAVLFCGLKLALAYRGDSLARRSDRCRSG